VFSGLCVWYIVARIDLAETGRVLGRSRLSLLALALAILVLAIVPLAWRWQRLLAARGIGDRFGWLLRAYLVSYTASQIFPTALGGDATRIYETARRHRGRSSEVAGSVLIERGLGAAATLLLGVVGFVLAFGRYDVGAYLWLELAIAVGASGLALVVFSRNARGPLRKLLPLLERVRLARAVSSLYRGLHGYRSHPRLIYRMLVLTLAVQTSRILALWLCGLAVGVHLSPLPYLVMGPMFFLVMLAPFTLNGFALREAFFVSFLGQLGVSADQAFSTGFVFFLLGLLQSFPGAVIWAVEAVRGPVLTELRTEPAVRS
jgi:uncharacterized protein (TIRG00374 family)